METGKKRSASTAMNVIKKKKLPTNTDELPVAGTRITDWDEYEKWKEVRGDIEPAMNYVEITPEAVEELRKIKNIIGDYICQLCKVKFENAFALAMHKCPRVVHIEFRCPECDKTFNCPANLASHRRWHKPQTNGTLPALPTSSLSSNKRPRQSSRSDSRSTNTSSSTISSEIIHEYSTTSSSSVHVPRKEPFYLGRTHEKAPSDVFRTVCNNGSPPRMSCLTQQSLLFPYRRPLPITVPTSFDYRRLQSACIFCQEQFAELTQLLQHIRNKHAVMSTTNNKQSAVTFDKLGF